MVKNEYGALVGQFGRGNSVMQRNSSGALIGQFGRGNPIMQKNPVSGALIGQFGQGNGQPIFKKVLPVKQASVKQAPAQQAPAQQVAKATPKETPGKGANRSAVGSLGTSSGAGVAGNAEAGLLGSVNTEVQNDDVLLPYQKV